MPIARLRLVSSKVLWTLYHHCHTERSQRYPLLGPSRSLTDLLHELDQPIRVFRD